MCVYAATLLVCILCLLSSKTKSPGDSSSIKENPSKGNPSPEKRLMCLGCLSKNASGVSSAAYEPTAMAAAISQSIQEYTLSPSPSSFHGFMQIVFNKSMLIQGPQVQAGRRKVTLRGKYSLHSLHGVVMEKNAPFFLPQAELVGLLSSALLHCCFAALLTRSLLHFIYLFVLFIFLISLTAAAWLDVQPCWGSS